MASWAGYQDMCFHVNTEENHRQAGRRLWNLFVSISVLKWLWYFIKFTATTHTKQSVLWLTTATWYDIVNWNALSENDGEMRIQKDQDTTSWRNAKVVKNHERGAKDGRKIKAERNMAEAEKRRNLKNQSWKKEGWGWTIDAKKRPKKSTWILQRQETKEEET